MARASKDTTDKFTSDPTVAAKTPAAMASESSGLSPDTLKAIALENELATLERKQRYLKKTR